MTTEQWMMIGIALAGLLVAVGIMMKQAIARRKQTRAYQKMLRRLIDETKYH